MTSTSAMNKYRDALDVLRRGRDLLVDELAEAVNDRAEDLLESPFLLGELLENHGMKLQFLTLMMSQLEQLADEQPSESRFGEEAGFSAPDAESPGGGEPRRRRRNRRRGGRRRNRTAGANHASDDLDR